MPWTANSAPSSTRAQRARAAVPLSDNEFRNEKGPAVPEAIEVRKVPIHSVSDASELVKLIDDGVMEASRVIAIDRHEKRLALAREAGAETINYEEVDSVLDVLRDKTAGRGPDAVVDAVGMEAHGFGALAQFLAQVHLGGDGAIVGAGDLDRAIAEQLPLRHARVQGRVGLLH